MLEDKASDAAFFNRLKEKMPENIIVLEREVNAENPEFVKEAVDLLIELIEDSSRGHD